MQPGAGGFDNYALAISLIREIISCANNNLGANLIKNRVIMGQ